MNAKGVKILPEAQESSQRPTKCVNVLSSLDTNTKILLKVYPKFAKRFVSTGNCTVY